MAITRRTVTAPVDELVERVRTAMAGARTSYELLFVDADGAGAGYASARGAFVLCLDGDRHPPELLLPMARVLLDRRADVVVATRYVPGGADALDGAWERAVAAGARDLTRGVLPRVRATTDPGSGCFGFARSVLEGVDRPSRGATTLVEVLARGRWERLAEVPYHSGPRAAPGPSRSVRDGARFLRRLAGLAADRSVPRAVPEASRVRTLHVITLDPELGLRGPTALVVCPPRRRQPAARPRTARRTA